MDHLMKCQPAGSSSSRQKMSIYTCVLLSPSPALLSHIQLWYFIKFMTLDSFCCVRYLSPGAFIKWALVSFFHVELRLSIDNPIPRITPTKKHNNIHPFIHSFCCLSRSSKGHSGGAGVSLRGQSSTPWISNRLIIPGPIQTDRSSILLA